MQKQKLCRFQKLFETISSPFLTRRLKAVVVPPTAKARGLPDADFCESIPPLPQQPVTKKSWSFWSVFSSTFLTIFLAEMGDKTQLATLLISAESQSPWVVFGGAAMALITTSLLGVVIGYWLAKRLAPKTLDLAVALLLLLITALLISDIISY